MTLNFVIALILRFFTEFERFSGRLYDSGWRSQSARQCRTVVRVIQKSIGNGTFLGAAAEKPLNRLTQNLAWVITSGRPLSTRKWHINRFRGVTPTKGWNVNGLCFYVCLFIRAARNQTAGPILTSNVSKRVFLEILHSFGG